MTRTVMTRIQYNLPASVLERLDVLAAKKEKPRNALITHALIQTYPEMRSLPSQILELFLHLKGSTS